MTLTLITIGRAFALGISGLGLACGALPRFAADEVGCRATIDLRGQVVADGVRWSHIDDERDRSFQNAWCAGVGPAVVYRAPEPVGEEVVASAEAGGTTPVANGTASAVTSDVPVLDSLLVVAYNAHIGAGDLGRLVDDIRSGDLTGAPVTHFVLLLQEVYRAELGVPGDDQLPSEAPSGSRTAETNRTPITRWAEAFGLHLVYVPSMRNGMGFDTPEDRGNAILSTLPLANPLALELPAGIQRRVTVVAAVEGRTSAGNEWALNVASAHLDNASISSPLASLGSVRARQASGLVRMLPSEGPLLVGGDFNTWLGQHEERAYRIMRDDFPWPRQHQQAPTAMRLGAGRIIDWLFFRGPSGWTFDDARASGTYGSDHYPVYGWVKIPAGGYAD